MSNDVVLVVDDDPAIRDLVQILLVRSLRLDVSLAADGESALKCVRRLRPALVLLDIDLPGLSGTEVARRLKADATTSTIPLFAFTGRSWYEVAEAGFDGYVGKPFRPARLVADLEKVLGRHADKSLLAAG